MDILPVTSADVPKIAHLQVIADRRMDVAMGYAEAYRAVLTPDEASWHIDVWKDTFNHLSRAINPDPLYQGLKAVKDGQIAGCIFTCTDKNNNMAGYVEGLFVHPDYWGQGVAKALISHAMGELKNRNVHLCHLWAESANEVLNDVYQKMGWTRNARECVAMRVNGRESSVVLFERHL